jgi:hypothetical protein
LLACGGPSIQIGSLEEELFINKTVITCPEIKFIEGLDKFTVNHENKMLYTLKFYEVKWKCYSNILEKNNKIDNVDLYISFIVDYIEDKNDFKEEKFSFIVALLNEDNKIITKKKINRYFFSKSKSEIIGDNEAFINIKVNNSADNIYNHKLLLGFYRNITE